MSEFGFKFDAMQKHWDDMTPDEGRRDERVWRVRATYEFETDIPGLELSEEIEEYLRDHCDAIFDRHVGTLAGWEEVEEKEEI